MIEISDKVVKSIIVERPSDSYKGMFGRVLLIGGSLNFGGAIIMATEAAVNSGAGLTSVATNINNLSSLHSRIPEAMFIDWQEANLVKVIKNSNIIAIGPGLGLDEHAQSLLQLVKRTVKNTQTVILDASALDLLAQDHTLMPTNAETIIMTPHQKEWERVSQIKIPFQEDKDNFSVLKSLFPDNNGILVLKSNHTKIYDCFGNIYQNPLGNPGMATGGMGDTLTGILAGFCGQFSAKIETIASAVYLHSLAGDELYKEHYVVLPTQLSAKIPQLMKKFSLE
ncbi:NAD(P)H-hydrate dehydratase [Lactobacillus jensenii]|uniref:NAD(P)H-hydrate dehydratase n=1 Tax=Lactobacillus jensenii TaxID=109790 RepID=UPI001F089D22|nr:NAD(P)H-hydrate dehydratase [Lactobacillus jensenii]